MNKKPPKVLVLGSINMDLVVPCPHLPAPGETVLAHGLQEISGGKGANQAVQAALAGGDVAMIGRVGDDAFANQLLANLQHQGVDTCGVLRTDQCTSGTAIVAVEKSGENSILVVPGANGSVSSTDVEAASDLIAAADVLLVQLEIPLPAVMTAIRIATGGGVRVILDPAPAIASPPPELLQVDLLCPNLSEAATLLGRELPTDTTTNAATGAPTDEEIQWATELLELGAKHVVLTLGERGALLLDGRRQPTAVAPIPIRAVDTTAAGDAFAGALAVHWANSGCLSDALSWATAAGAHAASRMGAQPSMGSHDELAQLVAQQNTARSADAP